MIGKHCVVRTTNAGVHIGEVESIDGQQIKLTNACRLWYWKGAFTLHAVARDGVKAGTRIAKPVDEILLLDAIEVIPTTEQARSTYEAFYE